MIAIIDYGIGNLFSLQCSFKKIGAEAKVTSSVSEIQNAEKIILPGVGAFADAAQKLRACGLDEVLKAQVKSGKYVMGICLGMQMLFEKSYEYGEHCGLGLIEGEIRPIAERIEEGLKVPQIGWNALHFGEEKHPLFHYLKEGDYVYFVHSYHAVAPESVITATTEYGGTLTAAAAKGNVMGCQFHPEKSGDVGLSILRAFCEM